MMDRKQKLPSWFYDRPELLPGQYFYISAFDRLTTCRSVSQGAVGRIPWTAVQLFAQTRQMDEQDFHIFESVLTKLDLFYVNWCHEEMKGESDA